jgi:hypothetical protein
MTSAGFTTDTVTTVAGLAISPATAVLQRRELLAGSDLTMLSRFGDGVWDLYPALTDQHSANQKIHWETYPAPFRLACKHYVFALLNVVEHAPRLAFAHADFPGVKTIWTELGYLRLFLGWLIEQGIHSFADVTTDALDGYLNTVTGNPASSTSRKAKTLRAVLRLHGYRQYLPPQHRLPEPLPWGGISAAELAEHADPRRAENRTARIHPDIMQPLLSAALLTVDTIAADLLPAMRQLVAMRAMALQLQPPDNQQRGQLSRWYRASDQLTRFLAALARAGRPLPGMAAEHGTAIDMTGLAFAGHIDGEMLRKVHCTQILADCDLPIEEDLLRVTNFTEVGGTPWRAQPVGATELISLTRRVRAACFLVIAYLSGVRAGEALNLRHGCVTRDDKLGLTFMSGIQLKVGAHRRERSPRTIPWVINDQGAHAITLLEAMSPSTVLFPPGKFGQPDWLTSPRSRTTGAMNDDIGAFIDWFNTAIAPTVGHPVVGTDAHGSITAQRLRRTLAWHIVRRPGGTIAGATQYGHLYSQITHGYAGDASSGFLDEVNFEEFLLRAERLHDDHQRLLAGEHVSGPAAGRYRERIVEAARFAGRTVSTNAQVNTALANPNLQIHHGALLTCVWRPESALCHDGTDSSRPAWSRCRLTCQNVAYTDRDIAELRRHARALEHDLARPGLPDPCDNASGYDSPTTNAPLPLTTPTSPSPPPTIRTASHEHHQPRNPALLRPISHPPSRRTAPRRRATTQRRQAHHRHARHRGRRWPPSALRAPRRPDRRVQDQRHRRRGQPRHPRTPPAAHRCTRKDPPARS